MLNPAERDEIADIIRAVVRAEIRDFAREHGLGQQILYSFAQAAAMLAISVGSLVELEKRGAVRSRRWGGKVLFQHEELVRASKHDLTRIWAPQIHNAETGKLKTVRIPAQARKAS